MKTVEELLEKYSEQHSEIDNAIHFCYKDLLQFIPFRTVYPLLEDKATPTEWGVYYRPLLKVNVREQIRDYMRHAWQTLCSERGISSLRSIAHFKAWLWILEEHQLMRFINNPMNYDCHGAPILEAICKRFRWKYQDFVNVHHQKTAAQFVERKGC